MGEPRGPVVLPARHRGRPRGASPGPRARGAGARGVEALVRDQTRGGAVRLHAEREAVCRGGVRDEAHQHETGGGGGRAEGADPGPNLPRELPPGGEGGGEGGEEESEQGRPRERGARGRAARKGGRRARADGRGGRGGRGGREFARAPRRRSSRRAARARAARESAGREGTPTWTRRSPRRGSARLRGTSERPERARDERKRAAPAARAFVSF